MGPARYLVPRQPLLGPTRLRVVAVVTPSRQAAPAVTAAWGPKRRPTRLAASPSAPPDGQREGQAPEDNSSSSPLLSPKPAPQQQQQPPPTKFRGEDGLIDGSARAITSNSSGAKATPRERRSSGHGTRTSPRRSKFATRRRQLKQQLMRSQQPQQPPPPLSKVDEPEEGEYEFNFSQYLVTLEKPLGMFGHAGGAIYSQL